MYHPKRRSRQSHHRLSKVQFAKLLIGRFRRAGGPSDFRYDPERFVLERGDREVVNLTNLYSDFCAADPTVGEDLLVRIVRSWIVASKGTPEQFGDAAPDLLPVIRSRSSLECRSAIGQMVDAGEENSVPFSILGMHYGVAVAYDLPDAMMAVNSSTLSSWGVDLAEALKIALSNLREVSRDALERADSGLWRSPWRDNRDSSRLLLPELIRAHPVAGDPIVLLPDRDTLLLTGSEEDTGLRRAAELIESRLDNPRHIGSIPLRLRGGEWIPWFPDPDHPQHRRLKRLWCFSFSEYYGRQRQQLQDVSRRSGDEVFVASYSAVPDSPIGPFSYCVWSEGIRSLLPRTDFIGFYRGVADENLLLGDWDTVARIAGDLMAPLDIYPERHLVHEFPSAGMLAGIQESPEGRRLAQALRGQRASPQRPS